MNKLILALSLSTIAFTGCTTANGMKNLIRKDLMEIVEYSDCPTVCAALKTYIATKLDGALPAEPTSKATDEGAEHVSAK